MDKVSRSAQRDDDTGLVVKELTLLCTPIYGLALRNRLLSANPNFGDISAPL